MSTATFTLTDESGAFATKLDFGPQGFKPESHAHQHALILHRHLESLCKPLDEPKVKTGILLPGGVVV